MLLISDAQLKILNSLVTYAVENLPAVADDEQEVARVVGRHALVGHEPLLTLDVQKVEVQGVEVSYPAWEVSVAGPEADAMLSIHRVEGEAIKVCEAVYAVLSMVLGESEVQRA
jgi:hypothetical protein